MIAPRRMCPGCKVEKDSAMFSKKQSKCKDCVKKYKKEYYIKNIVHMINQSKQYYADNKEIYRQNAKAYYKDNKEHILKQQKEYSTKNKDMKKERNEKYYLDNKKCLQEKKKHYRNNNRKNINKRRKERLKSDSLFQMRITISSTVNKIIKRYGGFLIVKKNN